QRDPRGGRPSHRARHDLIDEIEPATRTVHASCKLVRLGAHRVNARVEEPTPNGSDAIGIRIDGDDLRVLPEASESRYVELSQVAAAQHEDARTAALRREVEQRIANLSGCTTNACDRRKFALER